MNTTTRLASASCLKARSHATALLALCLLASAVVADPTMDTVTVSRSAKVSLGDLDLATPDGARAAGERLRQAARRLCTQVADDFDLSHQANFIACMDKNFDQRAAEAHPDQFSVGNLQRGASERSLGDPRSRGITVSRITHRITVVSVTATLVRSPFIDLQLFRLTDVQFQR